MHENYYQNLKAEAVERCRKITPLRDHNVPLPVGVAKIG